MNIAIKTYAANATHVFCFEWFVMAGYFALLLRSVIPCLSEKEELFGRSSYLIVFQA
jgi:hypothetical protein